METSNSSNVIIPNTNIADGLSVVQNVTASPFTNYTAVVVAYTTAGSGDSVMEAALSPEAGKIDMLLESCLKSLCYSFILPFTVPSPVQDIVVTFVEDSATYNRTLRTYDISVSISWQLPQYPNGLIVAYSYHLMETNSGIEIIADTNTTNLALSVVRNVTVSPFTNYTTTVVAYTSAGRGETATLVATSPEAGNLTYEYYQGLITWMHTALLLEICVHTFDIIHVCFEGT